MVDLVGGLRPPIDAAQRLFEQTHVAALLSGGDQPLLLEFTPFHLTLPGERMARRQGETVGVGNDQLEREIAVRPDAEGEAELRRAVSYGLYHRAGAALVHAQMDLGKLRAEVAHDAGQQVMRHARKAG